MTCPAPDVERIFINEDNLVEWRKARKQSNQSYINSGTVTWELKTADGASFDPVRTGSLTYVTASDGLWEGTINATDVDDLTEGETYFVDLTLTDGAGADGFRRLVRVAAYHGGED